MSRVLWKKKQDDSCPSGVLVDRKTLQSGRTVDVYQTPDGKLHEKTTGYLTAYGKRWEKEILPAIQKNAREATKRIKKRFGNHGERFDFEIRRMAEGVIGWLLETDQRSLPPKVLRAEVDSALDYLEAWMLRTDALEKTLRECSRVGHMHNVLSCTEVGAQIDVMVERLLGKDTPWPARVKELRHEVRKRLNRKKESHPADPPPRYDEVFAEGQKGLDSLDKPIEMLKLPSKTVKKARALIRKMVKRDEKRAKKDAKVLCTLPSEPLVSTSTKRCFLRTDKKE